MEVLTISLVETLLDPKLARKENTSLGVPKSSKQPSMMASWTTSPELESMDGNYGRPHSSEELIQEHEGHRC